MTQFFLKSIKNHYTGDDPKQRIYGNTWGSIGIPGNFEAGEHHLGRGGITVNNDTWGSIGIFGDL